jgi:sterol desaturase/sphingolipid hydroxylase (fatty acid hydroxylase superfamily)
VTELQMLAMAYVFFLALIGGELAVSRFKQDGGYRLGETVVNIGHGVVYQVFDFLTKSIVAIPFLAVGTLVSWELLPTHSAWGWLAGLVLYDFTSYWAHRHHHEIHFLWAIHGVHHAAEDYNFAAALRQPAFQRVFAWLWRLPLALVMPVEMFIGLVVFDFLYQFVQHTRYIGKLGPFGWIMNTPSHHRVHHGIEATYLDKNYGGILIVWDRLFGTFQAEEAEPTPGLTKPLGSLNPLWGNVAIFAELWAASRTVVGSNKLWLWIAGPAHLERLAPNHHYSNPSTPPDQSIPLNTRWYVMLTAITVPALLGWTILVGDTWTVVSQLAAAGFILASAVSAGALLERSTWAVPLELTRLFAAASAIAVATLL